MDSEETTQSTTTGENLGTNEQAEPETENTISSPKLDSIVSNQSNVEQKPAQVASPDEPMKDFEINPTADKEILDLEENRRKELVGNMEKIEKEFYHLKERFFIEKIDLLKTEYEELQKGNHSGFQSKVKELEVNKVQKIQAAQSWKEYQMQIVEMIYDSEKKQAEEEYKTDKKNLRDKMLEAALEKKKKLQEDKNTISLNADGSERIMTRTLRSKRGLKDAKEQGSYKKRVPPPSISYQLRENEITDDLSVIQKVLQNGSNGKGSSDVYTDRGRLYYFNQVFEKGRDVFIESEQESGKWHGSLVAVNPTEIHIRSADGTKSRFTLSHLRSGRYTITV